MQEDDAVRRMAAAAGLSLAGLSRAAGRSPNFVANTLNAGSSMTMATASSIARAAGYALAFAPAGSLPDGALVVDPPAAAQAARRPPA